MMHEPDTSLEYMFEYLLTKMKPNEYVVFRLTSRQCLLKWTHSYLPKI